MAAFLLLLHEKMRLQRKQNKLTLKQLNYSHLVERMEKKTKKRENYYSKLEKQIDKQANLMKNQMTMQLNNQYGTSSAGYMAGINSVFTAGGGMGCNQMQAQAMQAAMSQCDIKSGSKAEQALQYMLSGAGPYQFSKQKDADGKETDKYKANWGDQLTDIPEDQYTAAQKAYQMVQSYTSQVSTMVSNWKTAFEQQVAEWTEAQKEELDMQKEMEMDELADEQADLEGEKDATDAELELVKQNLQSVSQALSQSAQDAAPKFGLG